MRPTVKIGLVAPFEGQYRYVGYDVIYAVRLALVEANQDGGVGGYGVELVAYDDGGDPAVAPEQVGKLDVDPEVVGAIGHFREATTAAAVDAYVEAGIPFVAPAVFLPDAPGGEAGIYRLGPTAERVAEALVERAWQLAPAGEVVLVTQGGPLGEAVERAARDRTDGALPVVSPEREGWEADVLERQPAVVICDLEPVRAGEAVGALRHAGWSGAVLGGTALAAPDFAAVAGEAAVGVGFVTPWPLPGDVAGGEEFAAAYGDESGGTAPGPLALPAYESTWTLLQALEEAAVGGEPTRSGVGAALAGVERQGVLGRLSFGAGGAGADVRLHRYRIGPQGLPVREG